ncbi:lysine--tRNA ligase [Phenylobacterium sp. Root77]|uniref:lysine--tRNA ligase n=1 Tax=unclassified Phenylobacterium TaxID=2640670 RepID=UPI0006FBAC51|nr:MULTISPECIES: lysine--tRNA ligase [unclassified Phenylobacterium]KQW69262.1 lysine--tRNA ligase [Phenylobacterium sp. Root1277]KQW95371.1 lysine--tRNA ligase [Phenylobacterium sp. Root1290]KRC41162.1 lysine--tRNA ligase [Phenylobacterium sp. Root77]
MSDTSIQNPSLRGLSGQAREAKSWPFEQARILLDRTLKLRLSDAERDLAASLIGQGKADEAVSTFPALAQPVVFQCGFGASGLPHMGTFGEAARPTMVRTAFRALTDDAIPTKLIVFSDDMDGLRKIPDNVPNREMLEEDRDKPVSAVRDPFGEYESFAAHNNARLRAFLDGFGFDYEFMSSTDTYKSGRFDEVLLKILARFDAVQGVMLPTLGEERRATYSPFLPVSPTSGRVLQAPTLGRDVEKGTITFADEDGTLTEVPVTGGHVKLQWRPDWAARWYALGVDFEASGKDLVDSVRVSNKLVKVLGGTPPEAFHFELFMDENNQKISKSKGNGLTMEEWLRYGAPESLAYYMYQSPKSAKRLYFDVIPKATDEYLQQLEAFNKARATSNATAIDNPAWHVHRGAPPEKGSPLSFSLLLNLVSAADASTKDILWGFVSRYMPGADASSEPMLDRLIGYAINYYEDFVKPSKKFRAPDDKERAAMEELLARFKALPADADAETIQNEVFEVGKNAGFEPLRAWFQALYEVLLGQSQGPRFGSFAAIFGLERTIALIEQALAGELVAA